MKRRRFKKRIEVWRTDYVDDNSGGKLATDVKVSDSWCNIESVPLEKLTLYGLNENQQTIRIRLRYRSDLDYFDGDIFFRYNNQDWRPSAIRDNDLELEELTIIATAR